MGEVPEKYLRDFELIEAAALKGERCPRSHPHGPLRSNAVSELAYAGAIRSEVYAFNFRRITLLTGPHAGKSTANPPGHGPPYRRDLYT